jgi:hypothetical protein
VRGSWDPRKGPDRERSGVLLIGKRLQELVLRDDVLSVSTERDGSTCID